MCPSCFIKILSGSCLYVKFTVNLASLNQRQAWQTWWDQEKNRRNDIFSFIMTPGHFFLHLLASLAELCMHTHNHQFLWIYTFFPLGSIHLFPIIFYIFSASTSFSSHVFSLWFQSNYILHLHNDGKEQLAFGSKF